jgi:hypothetical protein
VDKEIGTDECVFGVFGPHSGDYGRAEVILVFHASVTWHPDTFLTPVAALGYHQGWYSKHNDMKLDRVAWTSIARPWATGGREDYDASKFHPSARGWATACALEWIARVAQVNGKAPQAVTLRDVQNMWRDANSHTAIEAHLPGLVPLDYVEKVLISTAAASALPAGTMETLRTVFGARAASGTMASQHIIETVPDTRKRLFEISVGATTATVPPWQVPRGFCFVVQPGLKEHICPLRIPDTRPTMIRFVASVPSDGGGDDGIL